MTDIFEYGSSRDFGEIHFKIDKNSELKAIIAIHNTKLGPALGGCRCLEYPSTDAATRDVMRLARAMSYKSALHRLPHGGGKAVLMRPKVIKDKVAYFKAFGRFINELRGKYITAVDSGTGVPDMDLIATQTPYVTSTSAKGGDTSHYTAIGVKHGIDAAIKHKYDRDNLHGIHVAIQGVGNVGYYLAMELHLAGARLTVCDINPEAAIKCATEFNAHVVKPEDIYGVECDVFSPCALGSIINEKTLPVLQTWIIAGSANNQLVNSAFGKVVHDKGILYAPDYVINAGGLIYAAGKYDHVSEPSIYDKLASIDETMGEIFLRAEQENRPPSLIADEIAEERLVAL
jgi:leucine dehydrogenase